jgi:hypothetical protein
MSQDRGQGNDGSCPPQRPCLKPCDEGFPSTEPADPTLRGGFPVTPTLVLTSLEPVDTQLPRQWQVDGMVPLSQCEL